MIEPGDLLGNRYRILKLLGQGSVGSVYLAENEQLEKQVAIKVSAVSNDPEVIDRFQREFRTIGSIHHPNVVELYDCGVLPEGAVYLVSEYVKGKSLQEVLRGFGRLSLHDALVLTKAIASALVAVHAAGIIHRDLKPSNIILPESTTGFQFDRARLIDFSVFGELIRNAKVRHEKLIALVISVIGVISGLAEAVSSIMKDAK